MKANPVKEKLFRISESKAKKLSLVLIGAVFILILLFVLIIALNPKGYSVVTYSFNTYVSQRIYGNNAEETAEKAADAAAKIEDLLSFEGENSEVALINKNAGDKWTLLSDLSFSILSEAKRLSEFTGGDFDITAASVTRLYKFGENFSVPDKDLIEKYKDYIDYNELRLNSEEKSASFAHFGYALDLDKVLFGAACDAAVEIYESEKVESASVVIGDTMGIMGDRDWEISVNTPEGDGELGVIKIKSGFISTESKYENYNICDNKEYHSIIDPKTGYPVNNKLESVTVMAESGLEAQALCYAAFVKGYNQSLSMLEDADAFAVFVFDDNTVRIFGETGVFTLTNENYKMR
ncbi:MAG: FAD:protein FMN transferase [Clostridia bacterium]|nr:FAD:protein FMN transferase [Clostridia bacterium]